MKLSKLLSGIDTKVRDCEINDVVIDSRQVKLGDMFVALSGENFDGHDYVDEALKNGAACVLVEKNIIKPNVVKVDNTRKSLAIVAANFWDKPRKKFQLVGITGTNGKTTTTFIVKNILECMNKKVGVIGTLGTFIGDKHIPSRLTTPDPMELQRLFSVMVAEKVDTVVMEVSAHAIALNKLWGIRFDVGVLTNVTLDHLDFFKSMECYAETKKSFIKNYCDKKIVNCDDEIGRTLMIENEKKGKDDLISFGIDNPADNFATNIHYSSLGTNYFLNLNDNLICVNTELCGKFNVENALAAACVCCSLNCDCEAIQSGINTMQAVKGRFNVIKLKNGASVVVDYAHTPDGLRSILKNVRTFTQNKLYCVFGCGGNRDKSKRPIMGEIASSLADFVVVTSDNSRYEKPEEIICEIARGIKKNNYKCITDRILAIKYVGELLRAGDCLVIAGKGAEEYLEIQGEKIEYSDYSVVDELAKNILHGDRKCIE